MTSAPSNVNGLKQWKRHRVFAVDVVLLAFDAFPAGAKNAVPETSLLAVVVALSPSIAVVQVMVFNNQLCDNLSRYKLSLSTPSNPSGRLEFTFSIGLLGKWLLEMFHISLCGIRLTLAFKPMSAVQKESPESHFSTMTRWEESPF